MKNMQTDKNKLQSFGVDERLKILKWKNEWKCIYDVHWSSVEIFWGTLRHHFFTLLEGFKID